jgi:hypothetical protein
MDKEAQSMIWPRDRLNNWEVMKIGRVVAYFPRKELANSRCEIWPGWAQICVWLGPEQAECRRRATFSRSCDLRKASLEFAVNRFSIIDAKIKIEGHVSTQHSDAESCLNQHTGLELRRTETHPSSRNLVRNYVARRSRQSC